LGSGSSTIAAFNSLTAAARQQALIHRSRRDGKTRGFEGWCGKILAFSCLW
jgi:hypothetical protein